MKEAFMQVFTSEELQLRPADVQQSALTEPTFITLEGRPRLVMMSVDAFDRLRRRPHTVLEAAVLPNDLIGEMAAIAAEYPDADDKSTILGGLLHADGPAGTAESL
jgi:PHD/YefM family antitoxin component YafN of YafNO toxin-antitoxin module